MTDEEVADMQRDGVHISTPCSLSRRVGRLLNSGLLTDNDFEKIIADSPFQTQLEVRQNKFWMTSTPVAVDDGGVEPLLQHWGGEVASMHLADHDILDKLSCIGTPRVVEVAVPLSATRHSYTAAEAALANFGAWNAWPVRHGAFDLYTEVDLPAASVLRVHSAGEPDFARMGMSYPVGLPDID